MAKSVTRHFVSFNSKGTTVWFRSSSSQAYFSATEGATTFIWHRDTRGLRPVREVRSADMKVLRDLAQARVRNRHEWHMQAWAKANPGKANPYGRAPTFSPGDSWVLSSEVPEAILDRLKVAVPVGV